MTATEFDAWVAATGATHCEDVHCNAADYTFYKLPDNWIAVLEFDRGEYFPVIQAADIEHAESWIGLREKIDVPITELVPDEPSRDNDDEWERW